jgi:hypothetical protein
MSFDESEYATDEVLNDLNEEEGSSTQGTINEALKRVEEANLLMLLVNKDIFSEGSARAEILESVQSRLKAWAISEIETLLNLAQSQPKAVAEVYKSPFDSEETTALKLLANRVLKRDTTAITVAAKEPEIKPITVPQATLRTPSVSKVQAPKKAAPAAPKKVESKGVQAKKGVPAGGPKPIPMATVAQAMDIASKTAGASGAQIGAIMTAVQPNESVAMATKKSNLIAAAIAQMTGGNQVAVLADTPSDSGDINERF